MRAVHVAHGAVRLTDFVSVHVLEDAFIEEGKAALTAAAMLAGSSCHCDTALISTGGQETTLPVPSFARQVTGMLTSWPWARMAAAE